MKLNVSSTKNQPSLKIHLYLFYINPKQWYRNCLPLPLGSDQVEGRKERHFYLFHSRYILFILYKSKTVVQKLSAIALMI